MPLSGWKVLCDGPAGGRRSRMLMLRSVSRGRTEETWVQLMCVEQATNTRLGDDVIYISTFRISTPYSLAQSIPLATPNMLNMKI